MPKHLLSDIRPLSRKPRATTAAAEVEHHIPTHTRRSTAPRLPREVPFEPAGPKHSSRYAIWWIAGAVLIGLLFALSFLFESATVKVSPKQIPLAFDQTDIFTAKKDSPNNDEISYTVMKLSGDESIKIPGTPAPAGAIASRGRVLLYNSYVSTPYKLIKSTRLQAPDGRIYRISEAATIPGYTMSGDTVVPGSVEVEAVADVAGEAGNLTTGDLTLPAFEGKAQFSKIYARTKTAMKGGVSGASYIVSADAADLAMGTLKKKLKDSLVTKAKVQIPDGYIFYEGATLFLSDDSPQTPSSTTAEVPVVLSGTLYAYLIKEDTLVNAIAKKFISQYDGEAVSVARIEGLNLVPAGDLEPLTEESFSFSFAGDAKLVWTVDQSLLKKMLAGQSKSNFNALLNSMPSIENADTTIKPFWKRSFPSDTKRIAIIIVEVK